MVAAFGRSQKRAASFGRRPLLGLYLIKRHPTLLLRVSFLYSFEYFWMCSCPFWVPPLLGISEILKIVHFDNFSYFFIGCPKCPK